MPQGALAEVVIRNVLFSHWPIDMAKLRAHVPDALSIDTFDETAWISALVVNIAEARVERVPYRPSLPTVILRTYVSHGDEPGVYFLDLEMDGQLSAWFARNAAGMPYYDADIDSGYRDGAFYVESHRTRRSGAPARFAATYRPDTDATPTTAEADTLAEFLIERTNYFFEAGPELRRTAALLGTTDDERRSSAGFGFGSGSGSESASSMVAGAATHDPWALQPVEADISGNTLFKAAGIPEPDAEETPVHHYSHQQHMVAERLRELSVASGD